MIRLRALGRIDLTAGEAADAKALLSQPKRFALLCFLAIPKPGTMFRRDALLGVFWPGDSEQPRVALRQALSHLRRTLGPEALVRRGSEEIGLNPDLFWCDVEAFEKALDAGNWSEAVKLYGGELLKSFYVANVPEWQRWLEAERARLASRNAVALEKLAEAATVAGDTRAAVEWWQSLVRHDPYDSRYAMSLMEALVRAGDPANALRHGQKHKDYLREKLDIAPPQEFESLVERLRLEHVPESETSEIDDARQDSAAEVVRRSEGSGAERKGASVGTDAHASSAALPLRSRVRRRWKSAAVIAAVTVALVTIAVSLRIPRPSGTRLDPDHVVVAVFRNATGDPSLDLFCERIGHWITQGLQHASVPVTTWDIAVQAWEYVQEEAQAGRVRSAVRALGEETGSGTVISGAVYLEGDSLEVQADVTDALQGRLLGSPPPITGGRDAQRQLIGDVQQQVMVFLAASFNDRLRGLSPNLVSEAPSFEAYQAFLRGFELHTALDFEGAIPHYRRAIELDSAWAQPLIRLRTAYSQVGTRAERDSVMFLLERLWDRLSQYEKAVVESFRAQDNGEREQFLAALRREVELAPGSPSVNNLALHLNRQNRPEEALTVLRSVDPERGWWRHWASYWELVSDAYHMLGKYEKELNAAQRCRRLQPGYPLCRAFQSRALAALGSVEELNELMHEIENSNDLPLVRSAIVRAAETLLANGHVEAARQIAERATVWFEDRPDAEAGTPDHRLWYGRALFLAGRAVESQDVFDALVKEFPNRVDTRSTRAFVAAMRGDTIQALEDYEWIRRYDGSEWAEDAVLWFRGIVAGALGRRDRAVASLSQAHRGFEVADRIALFYHPLRDYAPFREWLRPKG